MLCWLVHHSGNQSVDAHPPVVIIIFVCVRFRNISTVQEMTRGDPATKCSGWVRLVGRITVIGPSAVVAMLHMYVHCAAQGRGASLVLVADLAPYRRGDAGLRVTTIVHDRAWREAFLIPAGRPIVRK